MLASLVVCSLRDELDGLVTSRASIGFLSLRLVASAVAFLVRKIILSTVRLLPGLFLFQ
jgi:hypothetical protein